MRVLVDTSVWSAALRKGGANAASTLRLAKLIADAEVVLIGLVLQEVLQGFRSESFVKVAKNLAAFPLLQLDRAHYVGAATLHRTCAAHGVVVSTADCQIAAAAIAHRCRLFTLDRDFSRMADHSALRLL